MRVATIAAWLLLVWTVPAQACDKSEFGSADWAHRLPIPHRAFAEGQAEGSTMTSVRFAGAGVAALALAGVMLRALVRLETGAGTGRARIVEGEEVLSGAVAMR